MQRTTGVLIAIGLAAGLCSTAQAGGRVAVLGVAGDQTGDVEDALAAMVGGEHEVVSSQAFERAADRAGVKDLDTRGIAKVAKKLSVDAVLEGVLSRDDDGYQLLVRVRTQTGKTTKKLTVVMPGKQLSDKAKRSLGDRLLVAIDDLGAGGKSTRRVRDEAVEPDDDRDDADAGRADRGKPRRDRGGDDDRRTARDDDDRAAPRAARDDRSRDDRAARDDRDRGRDDRAARDDRDDRDRGRDDRAARDDRSRDDRDRRDRSARDDRGRDDDRAPRGDAGRDDARGRDDRAARDDRDRDDRAARDDREDRGREDRAARDDRDRDDREDRGDDRDARDRDRDRVALRDDDAVDGPDERDGIRATAEHHGRRRPVAAIVEAGPSVTGRTLAFTSRAQFDQAPTGYRGPYVPGAHVAGAVYPLAFTGGGAAAGLGVDFEYDQTLSLTTRTSAAPDVALPTAQKHWIVGARYRVPLGKAAVTLGVGYGRRIFIVDRSGLPAGADLDLPDVDYRFIAPSVGVRIPIGGRVAVTADGHALLFRKAGAIQNPDQYGGAKVTGGDAQVGLEVAVTSRVLVHLAGYATAIGFDFVGNGAASNNRDGDSGTQDVGGALDRYVGGTVAVGVAY